MLAGVAAHLVMRDLAAVCAAGRIARVCALGCKPVVVCIIVCIQLQSFLVVIILVWRSAILSVCWCALGVPNLCACHGILCWCPWLFRSALPLGTQVLPECRCCVLGSTREFCCCVRWARPFMSGWCFCLGGDEDGVDPHVPSLQTFVW